MIVAKKKIAFLMLLTFLLIFVEPFLGYAANNSISAGSSKTADIDTAGNLKFSVKAVGASSGTRWKTVGLYVTSDPTGRNGKEGTKAKDCVFFDKLPKGCSKKDETDRTGIVTTTFTISKDVFNSMCDKAGVNLKTLQKNGGKVYIQGVLQDTRSAKADQSATLPNAAIPIGRCRTHVTRDG